VRVDGGGAPDVGVGGSYAFVVGIVLVRGRAVRLVARTLLSRWILRAQLIRGVPDLRPVARGISLLHGIAPRTKKGCIQNCGGFEPWFGRCLARWR
jgi:hypothetical protein